MKLFVVAALFGVCAAGRLDRGYLPPGQSDAYNSGAGTFNSGSGAFNTGANTYQGSSFSARPQDAQAHTLRESSEVNEHGFSYDFETSNGIRAQQQGEATNGVQSQGAFSYKGDDGHDYSITYTADENGYRPQGAHLPTSPPVPEEILRSLELNARDEAAGIFDDGSYHESAQQYNAPVQQYKAPAQPSREYFAPAAQRSAPSFNSKSGYRY